MLAADWFADAAAARQILLRAGMGTAAAAAAPPSGVASPLAVILDDPMLRMTYVAAPTPTDASPAPSGAV